MQQAEEGFMFLIHRFHHVEGDDRGKWQSDGACVAQTTETEIGRLLAQAEDDWAQSRRGEQHQAMPVLTVGKGATHHGQV